MCVFSLNVPLSNWKESILELKMLENNSFESYMNSFVIICISRTLSIALGKKCQQYRNFQKSSRASTVYESSFLVSKVLNFITVNSLIVCIFERKIPLICLNVEIFYHLRYMLIHYYRKWCNFFFTKLRMQVLLDISFSIV